MSAAGEPAAARTERGRSPGGPRSARRTTVPRDRAPLPRLLGRLLGAGRRPADGGSTTAYDLAVRRRLLLALSALLTVSLFASYQGVHGDAGPLRTSSAPAVVSIDTALYALGEAEADATGATPSTSEFQKQISVAAQSLAQAAADDVGGPAGRQAVQTVAGLITEYTGMVQKAQLQPSGSVLREAYLSYASSMLKSDESGIEARLKLLQDQQRAAVRRQTSFGGPLWLGWSVAGLCALALGAALAETQLFLRRRFRRRYNRQLIGAAVLTAGGFVTLVLFTVWTHRGMADTRGLLDRVVAGQAVSDAGPRTASYLAHTGFRAAASAWIVIGGVLLMALTETGLRPHIDDYRFRPR
ncbi:hypothetical protein ACF09I_17500 [Streptomyces sp. NPDC014940]|uniref:hypothetical protein n=1 Tax=Streptomyces sp. NPDC014940 TaxID=3364932 RepID=UPI0036FD96E3